MHRPEQECFNGVISEKYFVISSGVGASKKMFDEPASFEIDEEVSVWVPRKGMKVAAKGVEVYRSCRSVRPKTITGVVA